MSMLQALTDALAIATAPLQTLCEWHEMLNTWDWPAAGLGQPEPPNYTGKDSRRGRLMRWMALRPGFEKALADHRQGRFYIELAALDDEDLYWPLKSSARTIEEALLQFKKDAEFIRREGHPVEEPTIARIIGLPQFNNRI